MSKKALTAIIVLSTAMWGAALSPAFAVNEINTAPGLSTAGAPLALHGYDPVAFFTVGKPVPGDSQFAFADKGVSYYFSSQANLDLFKASPAKYEPQYGGYCAFGVANNGKYDGSPFFWLIHEGKLYLNLSARAAENFKSNVPGYIKTADENWAKIQSKAPGEL